MVKFFVKNLKGMQMMKEDLRVVRTKKLLTNALRELLQEKAFDKITVNDICERAMVHRATFYNHFNDKTDLVNYIFDGVQEEIYQNVVKVKEDFSSKELYLFIIETIIDYCLNNKQRMKLILKNSTQEFGTILLENMKHGISYLVSKQKDSVIGQVNYNAIESFFTGGITTLCLEIVLSDKKIEKESLLEYLGKVIDVTLNIDK